MELEEYIKDATDEAMSDYIKSEKYKEHKCIFHLSSALFPGIQST